MKQVVGARNGRLPSPSVEVVSGSQRDLRYRVSAGGLGGDNCKDMRIS